MEKFLGIIADLLETEQTLTPDMEYRKFENWDSLTIVGLLAEINLEYHKTFRMKDFKDTVTLGDIYQIVQEAAKE